MKGLSITRRRLLAWTPAVLLAACHDASRAREQASAGLTLYTFGDSILDCGRYNAYGVHPGQLIVRNNDKLFPEFKGRDLQSRGPARLDHRAVDGATVAGLPAQARGLKADADSVALLTIGGNDLLRGLVADSGAGIRKFEFALETFLRELPSGRCSSAPYTIRRSATTRETFSLPMRGSHARITGA